MEGFGQGFNNGDFNCNEEMIDDCFAFTFNLKNGDVENEKQMNLIDLASPLNMKPNYHLQSPLIDIGGYMPQEDTEEEDDDIVVFSDDVETIDGLTGEELKHDDNDNKWVVKKKKIQFAPMVFGRASQKPFRRTFRTFKIDDSDENKNIDDTGDDWKKIKSKKVAASSILETEKKKMVPPPIAERTVFDELTEEDKTCELRDEKTGIFKNWKLLKIAIDANPFDYEQYKDCKPVEGFYFQIPPPPADCIEWGLRTCRSGADFICGIFPSVMTCKPYKYEIRLRTSYSGLSSKSFHISNCRIEMDIDDFRKFEYSKTIFEYKFTLQFRSKVRFGDNREFYLYIKKRGKILGRTENIKIKSKRSKEEYNFWKKVHDNKIKINSGNKRRRNDEAVDDEYEPPTKKIKIES